MIFVMHSYNCQACPTMPRAKIILQTLSGHITALQGTGRKLPLHQESPYVAVNVENYLFYDWGYTNARHSTIRSRVAIAVNTKLFPEEFFKEAVQPPPELQGRGGVVRYTRPQNYDVAPMSLYLSPTDFRGHEKLVAWARGYINALPARCTPFVFADANDDMGIRSGEDGLIINHPTPNVGASRPGPEGKNGRLFRSLWVDTEPRAIDIIVEAASGFTYFGPNSKEGDDKDKTRIDFACAPIGLSWKDIEILYKIGRRLQLSWETHQRDHVLLRIRFVVPRLFFALTPDLDPMTDSSFFRRCGRRIS